MNRLKISIITLIVMGVVLFFAVGLHMVVEGFGLNGISSIYLLILLVLLLFHFEWSIPEGETKENLKACVKLMAWLILLRGARYTAFSEHPFMQTYLWYLYYIPCVLIPYYSIRAAYSVGNDKKAGNPAWLQGIGLISCFLIGLVLTNHYHGQVFRFDPLFWQTGEEIYTHGIGYFLVWGWIMLILLWSFFLLIGRCRIEGCRRYVWLPLIPIVAGTLWMILISVQCPLIMNDGRNYLEFPEVYCFTIAYAWLCCMQIGILPANDRYVDLFKVSSIGARIMDRNERIIYKSRAYNSVEDNENTLVRSIAIQGGCALWQTDVTEFNRTNEELRNVRQKLSENVELIRLENEWKEKVASVDAKNALYDMISKRVSAQSLIISELTMQAGQSEEQRMICMQKICFYGSYIKRIANLMLLASLENEITIGELGLSIKESLRQLEFTRIKADITLEDPEKRYPSEQIIRTYEIFESLLEEGLDLLTGIYVNVSRSSCKLVLEGIEDQMIFSDSRINMEYEDGDCYINIPISRLTEDAVSQKPVQPEDEKEEEV